jgi:hypothetical protein
VLAIEEVITTSDEAEPDTVRSWIGPWHARVVFRSGEVLLDVQQRTVAAWDAEAQGWTVGPLDDWVDDIGAEAEKVLERYVAGPPKFKRIGKPEKLLGLKCDRFYAGAERKSPDGDVERIRQDLWVSRELTTVPQIVETYIAVASLFDATWVEVPVERPPGIVLQSVTSWRPADAPAREPAPSVTVRVESITHLVMPQTFFDPPVNLILPARAAASED